MSADKMRSLRSVRFLKKAEEIIQVFVGVGLLFISLGILIYTFWRLGVDLLEGRNVIHAFIVAIQDVLLVMIILEIFWTVTNYLEGKKITLEPFLFIAIISSVRGLLIQGTKAIEAAEMAFKENIYHVMMEIGVHVFQIFFLTIALYIVRKSRRFVD